MKHGLNYVNTSASVICDVNKLGKSYYVWQMPTQHLFKQRS